MHIRIKDGSLQDFADHLQLHKVPPVRYMLLGNFCFLLLFLNTLTYYILTHRSQDICDVRHREGRLQPHVPVEVPAQMSRDPRVRAPNFNVNDTIHPCKHYRLAKDWTPRGKMDFDALHLNHNYDLAELLDCTVVQLYAYECWFKVILHVFSLLASPLLHQRSIFFTIKAGAV